MARKEPTEKTKKIADRTVNFKCPSCGQCRPIEEMRTIKRFFPMLVVCQQCEKTTR